MLLLCSAEQFHYFYAAALQCLGAEVGIALLDNYSATVLQCLTIEIFL